MRDRMADELQADVLLYWNASGEALLIGARGDRRGSVDELLTGIVSGDDGGDLEGDGGGITGELGALFIRGGSATWWSGNHRVASGFVAGVCERVRFSVG